jgi:hypothetical protein
MSFETNTVDLLEEGPIIHAEIFPNEIAFLNEKNFNSGENFMSVRLLIDTGSNISGLDRKHIEKLNLKPYTDTEEWVNSNGGSWKVVRYGCVLYLPVFRKKALNIDILEGAYTGSGIDGVIGRDILRYCDFRYNGLTNQFRLEAKGF